MTPTRDQVPAADTWDLSPLFTDTAQWQAAFEKLQASYPGISAFAGTLAQGPQRLREVIDHLDGPEVDAALTRALTDRDWQVRQAAEDLSP